MFAVKGWSVSADKLKSEAAPGSTPADNVADGQQKDASKKRKRPQTNVTSSNVADLWERVIEGKPARNNKKKPKAHAPGSDVVDAAQTQAPEETGKSTSRDNSKKGSNIPGVESEGASQQDHHQIVHSGKGTKHKKQKSKGQAQTTDAAPSASEAHHHQGAEGDHTLESDHQPPGKRAKKNKKGGKNRDQAAEDEDERQQKSSKTSPTYTASAQNALAQATAFVATPERKMTAMQLKMAQKLVSSRFRHLNELLYTEPSAKAFEILEKDPEMFTQYHEGFRRQVSVWPENPVDGYLEDIMRRGQIKGPQKGKSSGGGRGYNNSSTINFATEPLPRTSGTCTIADLGCGDAKLAAELKSKKKALRLDILSYDLQSPSPHVTRADIANLPLADGSVNVAIFCLALMGTNWLDFVEEAYRVLHWKGELWVAEIKSRLGHVGAPGGKRAPGGNGGGNSVVTHSVGNRKKAAAAGNNPKKDPAAAAAAEKAQNAALAVEVDGAEDRRSETDVRAFVEALRKRGFVLQGEADLRNKMFVKMHFVKAAPATVGKNAFPAATDGDGAGDGGAGSGRSRSGRDSRMGRVSAKFVEEEDTSKADEGGILKPCLYKIR